MAKISQIAVFEHAYICSLIGYDPDTGLFRWLKDRTGGVRAGDIVGYPDRAGYLFVNFRKKHIYLHRLAWFITNGEWPSKDLDHKDGDIANNRMRNLREADDCQGNRNRGKHKNNTSGFKGVYFRKERKKWVAMARRNGKVALVKQADTAEAAAKIYDNFAREYDGEFSRLNFP